MLNVIFCKELIGYVLLFYVPALQGESLNLASDVHDVTVTVGLQPCNVTSLAETQLVCHPPPEQPAGVDENGRETTKMLPMVTVGFHFL